MRVGPLLVCRLTAQVHALNSREFTVSMKFVQKFYLLPVQCRWIRDNQIMAL